MSADNGGDRAAHMGLPWPQEYDKVSTLIREEWGVSEPIYLSRQLSGKSGALVYEADVVSRDFTGQAILKLDQSLDAAWQEDNEAERHRRAFEFSPDFAAVHLPRILHTLHHDKHLAILSTIAARGLEYVTPWTACSHDQQLSTVRRLSGELLEDWNRDYKIAPGMLLPQDLLAGWLGYRLDPAESRLHAFLRDDCGLDPDEPSLIFQGQWYPNPIAFAAQRSSEMERLRLRAAIGQVHGDLNGFNVLVGGSNTEDESYYLIDLADYEDKQFLFFDHAYFALSHLLAVREAAGPDDWHAILDHLAGRYRSNRERHLKGDDLGHIELLDVLQRQLFDWVDRHEANRLSNMENQFLLANVAVGVNFASKGIADRLRRFGFLYAASSLRSYLEHNRVDWPKHGPPFDLDDATRAVDVRTGVPGTDEAEHPPLPDKPAIAVLAFDNLSGNLDEEYFADGMTEEIITELSHVDWLMVISRGSTFTYKSRGVPMQQIARELGVHYVVEGSVRRDDDKVRVTARLTDAIENHHLWADRYQRNLEHIFSLQEEIAEAIVANIDYELKVAERDYARRKRGHISVWDKFQKSMWHFYKFTDVDATAAFEHLNQLAKQSPTFAPALAALSMIETRQLLLSETDKFDELLKRASDHAAQAVVADDRNSIAHVALSRVLMLQGDHDRAIEESETAVDLNPSSSGARLSLAQALIWAGRPEEALPILDMSIRLSPKGPFLELKKLGHAIAFYQLGRLSDAENVARGLAHGHRMKFGGVMMLAAVLARQDRLKEANETVQELLRLRPQLTISRFTSSWRGLAPNVEEALTADLRKAGLPD